jgi:uncharacterized protein
MSAEKTGRNDPCPCGSGKKYKNCCLQTEQQKHRTLTTPLGKRKFTAKIISSGNQKKVETEQEEQQQKAAVDYTTLMERSFGTAIHDSETPPIPSSSDQYISKIPNPS